MPVTTAEEMGKSLLVRLPWADTVIMAAAVADFRPTRSAPQKLKKKDRMTSLDLEPTEDILTQLAARRTTQILVGFAAETQDLLAHAREKLHAKAIDFIVANDVTVDGSGFGSDFNQVVLLHRTGHTKSFPLMPKRELADQILNSIKTLHKKTRKPARRSRGGNL